MLQSASMNLKSALSRPSPIVKAALTSSCIMMLGDVVAQRITTPKGQSHRWDLKRTARFGVVGATLHGPYFFSGMRAVDRRFGPEKSLKNAATKAFTAQLFLFPPFLPLLFGWVGVLEGKTPRQCVQKIRDNFWQAFAFGNVFWPSANLINFRFVEPHQRVLYVSCAGLLWNTYISWMNARKGAAVEIENYAKKAT